MTSLVELVPALPKVLLHDHLDGGLRPATVVDLARAAGHALPVAEPDALGRWFVAAAGAGSLERYLETFAHTVAVLQTADALRRVAREAVADLAADGVVYAEERWAPEQHLAGGLGLDEAVDAVAEGLADGVAAAAEAGRGIQVRQVLTAMRQSDRWAEVAELALAHRDHGVVGFDLAGPEAGYPADREPGVWQRLADAHFPVTVHAGEGDGLASLAAAVHRAHADRLGHGVRLVDDIRVDRGTGRAELGRLAHWVRDHQIPLEVCPVSNVQTGAAASIADHPITLLKELDFAVTVNTDNRLMSGTSLTREMTLLVQQAGWTLDDLADVTLTAAWSTFCHLDERRDLVDQVILPGFQQIEGALP